MPLRRNMARRSSKEWLVRIVLATVAVILGYYSATFSIAQVVAKRNPALAHQLAPYDGRITALLAASLAGDGSVSANRAQADKSAKLALRQNPVAVAAVSTLGLDAELRGDKAAALRYFTYAQKLSRRDLRTQLWAIEAAVGRNDVPEALRQYDITLRVFPNLGDLLYPILISANTDPAIRSELIRTLAGKPLWGPNFIKFAASNGPNPQSTAALFIGLHRAGVDVPETARADAVNTLIAAERYDAAWAYYASVQPGVDRRRSRDPRFEAVLDTPSKLDWIPVNDGGITSNIQGGLLDFAAPPTVSGPVLQQLQLLPPGNYRLIGHSIGIDQAQGALPYWTLRCKDGRELNRVDVPNSGQAGGVFSGTFRVPDNCPVQNLVLIARPSNAMTGLSGQFDRLALVPEK